MAQKGRGNFATFPPKIVFFIGETGDFNSPITPAYVDPNAVLRAGVPRFVVYQPFKANPLSRPRCWGKWFHG